MGIVDLSDAMKRLPGVNLRDYGGAGGMKTVSVRGLGSQHTGVILDGAPLSNLQTGEIDLSRYSLDNVSSMSLNIGDNEDIFMPARSAASASTLSINSWAPKISDLRPVTLSAQVKTGSFGMINPYLRFGLSDSRHLAFVFTGDYTHADNNYPYTVPNGRETMHARRKNSRLDAGHAELNFAYEPNPGSRLAAKAYYYDSYQHLPGPVILYNDESNQTLKEVNMFGQLHYRTRLSSMFTLSAMGKFNWNKTRYKDRDGIYPGGILDNHYIQREAYATATLLCTPMNGLALAYALDYFYNDLSSNLKSYSNPHRNSILQSLSAKYRIWRITLTARGLLSIYKDTPERGAKTLNHTGLSPSAGISIQPIGGSNLFFRLNYKNIFRMPTFNELYFDHYGSINLEPETTDQFNFGITYGLPSRSWLSALDITIDTYLNKVKNKIVAVPYNMFVWTMTNLGKVDAYGIDATLNAEFPVYRGQKIIASGNYSWQKALAKTSRDKLDWNKQLPYIPVHSGAFSIAWENPWVSVGLKGSGCSLRYASKENIPSSRLAGYMEFGFMAWHTFRFHGHELELRADLVNAFNKQYELVASYPMPGRAWLATIKFTL